jgi:hypothetical protein
MTESKIQPPEPGKPWTAEDRMRWLEVKLLHAQATLQTIANLKQGNELTGVPPGWSDKGHAAAEGLALGWLQGMPDGMKGVGEPMTGVGHDAPTVGSGG